MAGRRPMRRSCRCCRTANSVRLEKRRFVPEDRGRLVTAFLVSFFEHYVDTGFTAALEEKLDEVSAGKLNWRSVMRAFWEEFSQAVDQTKDLKISDVINALDQDLGRTSSRRGRRQIRGCAPPAALDGSGRNWGAGSFIGCSNYPECRYTRRLAIDSGDEGGRR